MKIKLTEEQVNLLKRGTIVTVKSGTEYFYLPYWYKKEGDFYEEMSFDYIPKELSEHIKNMEL